VLRLPAFKFALQPNGEQLRNLRQFAGACRFVSHEGWALKPAHRSREPQDASEVCLCGVRILSPCRFCWRCEYERGGTRLVTLFATFA
jgi:hypothetical protein